jgi:DsbC/DsbD-like thiol-disulfide interchange protein
MSSRFAVNPAPAWPQSAPNIGVSGNVTPGNLKRGRPVKGTITMDIPAGYHVNSNHPLEQFLVATKLTVDAPQGMRMGPIVYPRAVLRTFKFSKSQVSVYEGRAVMRFSMSVPANAATGSVELRAHLRYQSCNDSLCFPPKNQDVNLSVTIN